MSLETKLFKIEEKLRRQRPVHMAASIATEAEAIFFGTVPHVAPELLLHPTGVVGEVIAAFGAPILDNEGGKIRVRWPQSVEREGARFGTAAQPQIQASSDIKSQAGDVQAIDIKGE